MNYKNLLFTAALALLAGNATAQNDMSGALKSYSYVEAQGGLQLTSTNADMTKLMTPTAAFSFGHYFSPVVGVRLHVNAWQSKSGFKDLDKFYKWKYITPSADVMLNLTNLFAAEASHPLNVILLGGVGLNYAWDNDELKDLNVPITRIPLAWDDNRLSHNLRAGLRLETDVTKPLGFSLELAANSLDDRFNSKTNDADDWQFTAMLGVSFRFGQGHYKKAAPVKTVTKPQPVVQQPVVEKKPETEKVVPATPVVEPKPQQPVKKAVVKKDQLKEEIFYVICKSDPKDAGQDQLKRVADFMKKYKDAKVQVVGYADKGTGNAEVNKMYAERRATECKDALVKKYGCDAARISIDSKGDTVQPFAENDKNRCVIIESTAEYTVYE
ncbi:MAG: OmpA family protein [Prevotella sp.]|nr:OmpA family protein [Prevotella sp.]